MALAIGVRKGSRIDIAGDVLEVKEIHGLNVSVAVAYPDQLLSLVVTDQCRDKLRNQVFVSTAKSKNGDGYTRLLFEAPAAVKISRLPEASNAPV